MLEPDSPQRLANLCGQFDEHLKQIERGCNTRIENRGNIFNVIGTETNVHKTTHLLKTLYKSTESFPPLDPNVIHLMIRETSMKDTQNESSDKPTRDVQAVKHDSQNDNLVMSEEALTCIPTKKKRIAARGANQRQYVDQIHKHDISFGVGPAGTGKTYLAVACAVEALEAGQVKRIVLVRPAVEAGEKLGFLPGDLAEKVNPYLRPLYDALHEMLGFEQVSRLMDRQVIEVAPLAYMRGRTLNDAFIILDEGQNTTREQMKMLLTRLGFGSKVVITGDHTQIDLPRGTQSGLIHAVEILRDVPGIGFSYFTSKDVVRHKLVQDIVEAYERSGKTTQLDPHVSLLHAQNESK